MNKALVNFASRLLQPINIIPQGAVRSSEKVQLSKSHRLMVDLGIIRPSSSGLYSILPLGIRSLDKFKNVIKLEMTKLCAYEVKLPYLTDSDVWKKSGRLNNQDLGIFTLKDRHQREFILSPTYEEVAADLISTIPQISTHELPILIYQMSTKFRDEIKPRCGLLKSKEFEMLDLYSFDECHETADMTYDEISAVFQNIFDTIGIPVVRVEASTGDMKGLFSHEFHVCNDLGEDRIICCRKCRHSSNLEQRDLNKCEKCKSNDVLITKGVEVAHTFYLTQAYTDSYHVSFEQSACSENFFMASYGLGITRTLAAGIECLSTDDSIIWPNLLAPFSVVIIPPKNGSHEYEIGTRLSEDLYSKMNEIPSLFNDILIDDRADMTIGRRLVHAKQMGYPNVIVIGSKATQSPPIFEVHNLKNNSEQNVTFEAVIDILKNETKNNSLKMFA